jgi:hypothetical protein
MHHPSQAHGYDSVIDGGITIELPSKLVTYHINPLSLSLPFPPFPPLLGALFNEVYQGFIIYVGCGFHHLCWMRVSPLQGSIHQLINQSGAKYFLKGFMFSGNENLLNLRRMKAKNCVFWAGI